MEDRSTMRTNRRYDDEFKKEAVQMMLNGGRLLKDVASDLGIDRSVLGRWKKLYLEKLDSGVSSSGMKPSEMDNENRRLRKELAYVKEQRDILKKAVSIFSREPDRYTSS